MERYPSARHYETVERAIGFIRNNVRRQPTMEEIAQAVHMSPFHLQRVFSEWAGLSPKRFLQYLTKEHAKASLLRSRTVLEVADDLGMSSSSRLHDLMVPSEAMTWARSSGPNGPSASSTSPPDWLMDERIWARTSSHRPPLRGAA